MEQIPYPTIVPCTHFKTEHIWHQSFPFLKTEAALETFDANGDSVLDIVIGFSTGIVSICKQISRVQFALYQFGREFIVVISWAVCFVFCTYYITYIHTLSLSLPAKFLS